jgi:opacity protein-like surface antigen
MKTTFHMKKCLLLILGAVSLLGSSAQIHSTFIPASITFRDGQTRKGFIRDEPIKKLNFRIYFKTALSEKSPLRYDTSTVEAIQFDRGDVLEAMRVSLFERPDSITLLASLMLKGKASLYTGFVEDRQIYVVRNNGQNYSLENDELSTGFNSSMINRNFRPRLDSALQMKEISIIERINTMAFNDEAFFKLITSYNQKSGSESLIKNRNYPAARYLVAGAGGFATGSSDHELNLFLNYRVYIPKVSHDLSLNVGLNYNQRVYTKPDPNNVQSKIGYTGNLVSLPFFLQQNFLSGSVRPYIIGGVDLYYIRLTDQFGTDKLLESHDSPRGISILAGAGIEVNLAAGLMAKGEYRYDNWVYLHQVSLGLAYWIKVSP